MIGINGAKATLGMNGVKATHYWTVSSVPKRGRDREQDDPSKKSR